MLYIYLSMICATVGIVALFVAIYRTAQPTHKENPHA